MVNSFHGKKQLDFSLSVRANLEWLKRPQRFLKLLNERFRGISTCKARSKTLAEIVAFDSCRATIYDNYLKAQAQNFVTRFQANRLPGEQKRLRKMVQRKYFFALNDKCHISVTGRVTHYSFFVLRSMYSITVFAHISAGYAAATINKRTT